MQKNANAVALARSEKLTKGYEPELPRLIGNMQAVINAYSEHTGLDEANTIRTVLGYGTAQKIYIPNIDVYAGRYDKWLAEFSRQWPADLAWPEGIGRPPVGVSTVEAA